jgi:hypothetical protein
MTTHADRLKASHRGAQLAAPASASRLASLEYHKLRYEMLDDGTVLVEGEFVFNLAASHWRSNKHSDCHGYTVVGLAGAIKQRTPEKPAAGRDNMQVELETTESHQHVESAAGPNTVLPMSKWP